MDPKLVGDGARAEAGGGLDADWTQETALVVVVVPVSTSLQVPTKPPPPKTGLSSLQAARQRMQARTGEGMAQRTMLDFARTKKSTTVKTGKQVNVAPATVIDLTI